MKKVTLTIFAGIIALLFSARALATDRNFVFTYESRTLQGGLRELETWVTYKFGRQDFYSAVENRIEFEIGLSKRLQTSFYLNLDAETSPHTTLNPIIDESGELILEPVTQLKTNFNIGFSNEWKYQISDPSANKIGSALYGEISISPGEYELETKVILDKKINRFTTALNLVGEVEWEAEEEEGETELEREYAIEFDYGLSYELPRNFFIGFEARNVNLIEDELEHSPLFAGPVFSYRQNNWWLAFGVQPQICDLKNTGVDLEYHEKVNARLLFSWSF